MDACNDMLIVSTAPFMCAVDGLDLLAELVDRCKRLKSQTCDVMVDTCEALCVVASKLNNDHSLAAMRLSMHSVNHPSADILDLALLMNEDVANP